MVVNSVAEQDYLNLVESNEDLDIDLEAGMDLLTLVDVRQCEGFTYPAILLSGIRFNDALRVLQTVYRPSYRLVDVWVDVGDGSEPVHQGQLPFDSKTLLTIRYLGLKVTAYMSDDDVRALDLNDVSLLEDCI